MSNEQEHGTSPTRRDYEIAYDAVWAHRVQVGNKEPITREDVELHLRQAGYCLPDPNADEEVE